MDDQQLGLGLAVGTEESPLRPGTPDEEAIAVAALSKVRGVGQSSLRALYESAGSLWGWLHAEPSSAARHVPTTALRGTRLTRDEFLAGRKTWLGEGRREIARLHRQGVRIVLDGDPAFPERLRKVSDPPRWLYVQGDASLLTREDCVAVVGTREPSPSGLRLARRVAEWLIRRDVVVISGLAEGIDAEAQQAAVDAGVPTIGVLGHGIDVVFPASTAALRSEVIESGGAVMTEYLPSDRYEARKFVQRNRLQAGLAGAVIAIEAKPQSGTAHTVRFAQELGRLLLGVRANGSSFDLESGIHQLIVERGGTIVDLASPTANETFSALLSPALGRAISAVATRDSMAAYERLILDFRAVAMRHPLSETEFESMLHRVRTTWESVREQNGT